MTVSVRVSRKYQFFSQDADHSSEPSGSFITRWRVPSSHPALQMDAPQGSCTSASPGCQ